jgi:hypothetical protein
VSPVVRRGGVLGRLTSFAACRNLIFSRCRRTYRVVGTVPYPLLLSWSSLDCVSLFATYRDLIDYPLSTDLSNSWQLLPRCLLLAWWLPRPLTLRRDVSERALSAVDVPVERVASVAVLPVTCVVVLGKPARGRDVSKPYSSVVGDLSSSWRLFFLLLDTC